MPLAADSSDVVIWSEADTTLGVDVLRNDYGVESGSSAKLMQDPSSSHGIAASVNASNVLVLRAAIETALHPGQSITFTYINTNAQTGRRLLYIEEPRVTVIAGEEFVVCDNN